MIRKEVRRLMVASATAASQQSNGLQPAGNAAADGAAVGGGGGLEEGAGFRLEAAGLHAQRSWFELSLWAFGKRVESGCAR